jgi:hypothetical protein
MSENSPRGGQPEHERRSAATEQRLSGRAQRRIAQEQAAKRQRLMTIVGGVVAIAVVALLVFFVFVRKPGTPSVEIAAPLDPGIPAAGRTLGNPDAPVTVVEWGDYQ